jgi:peptide/nickel transport system substrate-binding protein
MSRAIAIASISALTVFGVASCGGDSESKGGDLNVTVTAFPDYVDPQLSYTVTGWEVLWNIYTPLLTYKHAKGDAGTEIVPGLAKDMPTISADGKTYKLTLRPNMKYSDGTPIKASDFT